MSRLKLTPQMEEKFKDYFIYSKFWQSAEQTIFGALIAIFASLLFIDMFKQHTIDFWVRLSAIIWLLIFGLISIGVFSLALDYTRPSRIKRIYYVLAPVIYLFFGTLQLLLSKFYHELGGNELKYLKYLIAGFLPFILIVWCAYHEILLSRSKTVRKHSEEKLFESDC